MSVIEKFFVKNNFYRKVIIVIETLCIEISQQKFYLKAYCNKAEKNSLILLCTGYFTITREKI